MKENDLNTMESSGRPYKRRRTEKTSVAAFIVCLRSLVIFTIFPFLVQGQSGFSGCTELESNTWEALVQAISGSYIIATLCPFRINGDGCPSQEQYPDGIIFGPEINDIMIVECNDVSDRFGADGAFARCVIDCPGRHFTIAASPTGLIMTNMVLSGATKSSILVEVGGSLEVVNTIFSNNSAGVENGGAITAKQDSTIDIEFCTFTGNQGVTGGALHLESSTLKARQSIFRENGANAAGGAIAVHGASTIDIEHSSFTRNQASSGGALYLAEYGDATIARSIFEENLASFGGAIFTEGVATIGESTFKENTGFDSGGAINCDAGSSTALLRNTFINNESGGYGPAVCDRYNSGVLLEENVGCGNLVKVNGQVPVNRFIQCEGVYVLAGRRRTRRCDAFQNECVAPTESPTKSPMPSFWPTSDLKTSTTNFPLMSPSITPTIMPSLNPSNLPIRSTSNEPSSLLTPIPSKKSSSMPTAEPSHHPSIIPSGATSFGPSRIATVIPSESLVPSDTLSLGPTRGATSMPSDELSFLSSDTPSTLVPSRSTTVTPGDAPSFLPSDTPSMPSDELSFLPSDRPSALAPSLSAAVVPSDELSFNPSATRSSLIPSMSATVMPSDELSFNPSDTPSQFPSKSATGVPTDGSSDGPTVLPSQFVTDTTSGGPSTVPYSAPPLFLSDAPSYVPTA